MTSLRVLATVLLLASGAVAAPNGPRIWNFTSGQKVTAKYLWVDGKTLYLRDPSGKELRIPVGLLSNADLEFVREIRNKLKAEGIIYEAPRTWQNYHSKNVKALDADRSGVYPLDSQENGKGRLELEFTPVGTPPPVRPGLRPVLRMTTARNDDSGTNSVVRVVHQGRVVGALSQIRPASTFDIPLSPALFAGTGSITVTVTCGADTIRLRSGKSGAGPRLLIVETKPE